MRGGGSDFICPDLAAGGTTCRRVTQGIIHALGEGPGARGRPRAPRLDPDKTTETLSVNVVLETLPEGSRETWL